MTDETCEYCGGELPCTNPYDEVEYEYDLYESAHDPEVPPSFLSIDPEVEKAADKALRDSEHARLIRPHDAEPPGDGNRRRGRSITYTAIDWSM